MTARLFSRRFLPAAATQTHAHAYSETAQSLVGRARFAWELATGASAVAGEVPMVETNPQGQIGVDMSGPPFGPALLLPVWEWVGQPDGGVSPNNYLSAVGTTTVRLPQFSMWNRPHAVRPDGLAPLQQMAFVHRTQSGAGTSTVLTITFRNLTNGTEVKFTRTINVTTTTDYTETGYVPLAPGLNSLQVSARASVGTRIFNIRSMLLAVDVKRRVGLSFPG